ncbi:MAG: glycosyltransferase [Candidatus Eisenbacteria bacterium]|uniref:Glycosyltransferase n=1 Tax=Eiseniibacteriota bacterium TaxID=2212470 RepID=A0A7Y2H3Z3_UNCEI|nr:glycosyltransferase [Candidatus Eisenbacteria bacterium]
MSSRLKVLHVTAMYPSPKRPGRGAFVKAQVDSLREHADIEVFVIEGSHGLLPYVKKWPDLRSRLYAPDYDVVHAHYGNLGSLVRILGTKGRPLVTSYCGSDLLADRSSHQPRLRDRFYGPVNRYYARFNEMALVKSRGLAEQIESFTENVAVIPNGVDTKLFKPMDRDACREELELSPDVKVVLFGADPHNTIKNFNLLESAARPLGDKVLIQTFAGGKIPHDKVPLYMNAADVVALTSHHEGSPNVVKEALACSRPVFATDCGDVQEVLGGVEGSRVLSYSATEWTEALRDLVEGKVPTVTNGAAQIRAKGLDAESVAQQLMAIYKKLAAEATQPV